MANPDPIGGEFCAQPLRPDLLPADPRGLARREVDGLWRIFVEIGVTWDNTFNDSAGLKSSWLEFVTEKTVRRPSYVAEYLNALEVVGELVAMYKGSDLSPSAQLDWWKGSKVPRDFRPLDQLFFDHGMPLDRNGVPVALDTRLAHAKYFVVDEFIRVQVVAGGFRRFIQPVIPPIRPEHLVNYNGFIAGSRYSRILPVRPSIAPSSPP